MKKVLIIEGTKDESNGILRQGFNKLLSQKLKGSMPRIIMGEGKTQAIKKFKNYRITKATKRGKYHKVAHAVELLQKLDANKLSTEFVDFRNLIETLKN